VASPAARTTYPPPLEAWGYHLAPAFGLAAEAASRNFNLSPAFGVGRLLIPRPRRAWFPTAAWLAGGGLCLLLPLV